MDWRAWHRQYDDPHSELSRRLEAVQAQIRSALDRAPDAGVGFGVGVHRFAGVPQPLVEGQRLFRFVPGGV